METSSCVVLVPVAVQVEPACEAALVALERRGYPVRRVYGYAAIDQARNEMATAALSEGFEETMWIDSDVSFDPAAVDRLRSHELPIVCGIYARKAQRALACDTLAGTKQFLFGEGGGLVELRYAAGGFALVRRQVYEDIQEKLALSMCNARIGRPSVPFYQPMTVDHDEGPTSLSEDYAFSNRARQCGYKIMADTTIRLWHHGSYGYGWEDAGIEKERYETFYFNVA